MPNWTRLLASLTIILAAFGTAQGHFAEECLPVQVVSKAVREELEFITMDLSIPVIEGMADSALQERLNRQLEDRIMAFAAELASEAQLAAKEVERQYQAYTHFEVFGNQSTLSVAVTFYQYTGGAHGLSFIESINLDLASGRLLTLADLLPDENRREMLLKAIREQIAAAPENYFSDSLNLTTLPDEEDFYIEGDQLVVYYGLYEIAPYATGIPAFKIPLSLLD